MPTVPPPRELVEGPWRILYAIDADIVLVIAVVDNRRSIEAWVAQRFESDRIELDRIELNQVELDRAHD